MPKISTYNNQPILVLNPDVKDPYVPFSFGLAKAEVIIDRMSDIEKFLETHKHDSDRIDLTPQSNQTGKRFIITKFKAKLILKYKEEIQSFVHNGTARRVSYFHKKVEEESNARRFSPGDLI